MIAAVVLLNLLVRAIPSKYTEFDLSEAGLYTLWRQLQAGDTGAFAGM